MLRRSNLLQGVLDQAYWLLGGRKLLFPVYWSLVSPKIMQNHIFHMIVTLPTYFAHRVKCVVDYNWTHQWMPQSCNHQHPNLWATSPKRSKALRFNLSSVPSIWGVSYCLKLRTVVNRILQDAWQGAHLPEQQGDSQALLASSDSLSQKCLHLSGVGSHHHLHPLLPPHLALRPHHQHDQEKGWDPHVSPSNAAFLTNWPLFSWQGRWHLGVHLRDTYGRAGAVDRHDLLKDIAHRQTVGPVHLARAPSVARGRWLWCTIADRPPTVGGQLQLRTTTPSINLLPT